MVDEAINKAFYPLQRFKVMGFLGQVEESNYVSIGEFTSLSITDISKTIRALRENEYVKVGKERRERYSETIVRNTELGRREMAQLIRALKK